MDTQTIKELFIEIACIAMERGREICLEKSRSKSDSQALGGAISKSFSITDGLALHVYSGLPEADEEEDAEEPED